MLLSAIQEAAARALVALLRYQSGHAQQEALSFPEEVAQAIADHGQDPINGAQAIKDELARLYDRRRDGHARSIADEMKHQQHVLAARIVLERELGCSPDQSTAATSLMNDAELAEVASLATEPNCREQVLAINARSAERIIAAQAPAGDEFAAVDTAAAAEEQLAANIARTEADAAQKAAEEAPQEPVSPETPAT